MLLVFIISQNKLYSPLFLLLFQIKGLINLTQNLCYLRTVEYHQ